MLRTPDRAARRSRATSRSHGRATIATERDWQNSSLLGTFPFRCAGRPLGSRPLLLFLELHDIGLEAVEPRLPDRALLLEPVLRADERVGAEAAGAHAAGFLGLHEPARLQHMDVFHE